MSAMRFSSRGPSGARKDCETRLDCVSVLKSRTYNMFWRLDVGVCELGEKQCYQPVHIFLQIRNKYSLRHHAVWEISWETHQLDFNFPLELLSQVYLAVDRGNSHVWPVTWQGFFSFFSAILQRAFTFSFQLFFLLRNNMVNWSIIKGHQLQKFIIIFSLRHLFIKFSSYFKEWEFYFPEI